MQAPTPNRPRLLLIAYACRPNEGSEPGMGWNRSIQASKEFDTWVLCEGTRSKPAIEAYQEAHGKIKGLQFIYVPRTKFEQRLAQVPGFFYVAYNLWHRRAIKVAEQLHEQVGFDLVHQATYCGYREPGYGWRLPVPFIWGPVGGTHNYPMQFLSQAGFWGAISEGGRSLANNLQFALSRRIRTAATKAALALAGNSATRRHFKNALNIDMPLFPASGIADAIAAPRQPRDGKKIRLLWCGYLHPLKGLPILLEALAKLPSDTQFELRVVGDGPYRKRWQQLARKLGIADRIEWTGRIPHQQALEQYQWADLFVFTSLRDTFPTVVLESLAAGLPVICLDHLGMGDIVDATCGRKIPLSTPENAARDFRNAILELSGDAEQWRRLSVGATERAREYTWSHQGRRLAEMYRDVLAKSAQPTQRNALASKPSPMVVEETHPVSCSN